MTDTKTAGEIHSMITKLALERGEYEVDTPEYEAISERMTGLKQTFIVLYNAQTSSESIAFMRNGSVVVAAKGVE